MQTVCFFHKLLSILKQKCLSLSAAFWVLIYLWQEKTWLTSSTCTNSVSPFFRNSSGPSKANTTKPAVLDHSSIKDMTPAAAVQGTSDGKYREKSEDNKKNTKAGEVKPVKVHLQASSLACIIGQKKLAFCPYFAGKEKEEKKEVFKVKVWVTSWKVNSHTNLFLEISCPNVSVDHSNYFLTIHFFLIRDKKRKRKKRRKSRSHSHGSRRKHSRNSSSNKNKSSNNIAGQGKKGDLSKVKGSSSSSAASKLKNTASLQILQNYNDEDSPNNDKINLFTGEESKNSITISR